MFKSCFNFKSFAPNGCFPAWVEAAAGLWLCILLTSWRGRNLARILEYHGLVPLMGVLVGLLLLVAATEGLWAGKGRLDWRSWVWIGLALLVFLLLPWQLQPVERLHLALFGGLGYCLGRGLPPRWAGGLALAASLGDEGFQYLLPERYADLRDVGINLLAATAGWGVSRLHQPQAAAQTGQ